MMRAKDYAEKKPMLDALQKPQPPPTQPPSDNSRADAPEDADYFG